MEHLYVSICAKYTYISYKYCDHDIFSITSQNSDGGDYVKEEE